MSKAQDKVNDAAKENAEAAKDQAESNEAAAKKHLKTKTVFSVIKKTRQMRVFFCLSFVPLQQNSSKSRTNHQQ